MYLNRFLSDKHIDILCLQETWLQDRNIDKLNDMHPAYQTCGKSGVDAAKRILPGRPPGGVAIAWRQSLSHNIRVIDIDNRRICAVRFELKDVVTPYTHMSEASRYILYTIILTFDGICTIS